MTYKLLERDAAKEILLKKEPLVDLGIRKGMDLIEIKAEGDDLLRFIISNGSLDRDHDTIEVLGWDLDNFRKTPGVLWAHSHSLPVVGKSVQIFIEGENLISDVQFVPPDISEFADMIFKLYKGGFMNAVSVGFLPLEWVWVDEQGGFNFSKQELLEFSTVPIPSNPTALQIARSSGIDTSAMKSWAEKVIDEWNDSDHLGITNKEMKRLAKAADSKHKSYHHLTEAQQKKLREENIWSPRIKIFESEREWDVENYGPTPFAKGCKAPLELVIKLIPILHDSMFVDAFKSFDDIDDFVMDCDRVKDTGVCDVCGGTELVPMDSEPGSFADGPCPKCRPDDNSEKDLTDVKHEVQIQLVYDGTGVGSVIAVLDAEKCAEAANLADGWTSDDLLKVLAGPPMPLRITVNIVGTVAEIVATGQDSESIVEKIIVAIDELDWKPEKITVAAGSDPILALKAIELSRLRERLEHLGLSDIDTLELEDIEVSAEEQASRKDIEDRLTLLEKSTKQWKKAAEDLIEAVDILQAENDELTESVIESELNKELETEKSAVVVLLQAFKSGINRITGRVD